MRIKYMILFDLTGLIDKWLIVRFKCVQSGSMKLKKSNCP